MRIKTVIIYTGARKLFEHIKRRGNTNQSKQCMHSNLASQSTYTIEPNHMSKPHRTDISVLNFTNNEFILTIFAADFL